MPRQTEWLNANKYRRYPFIEDCNVATSGGFDIPNAAVLDVLAIDYYRVPQRLLLSDIEIYAGSPNYVAFNFYWATIGVPMPLIVPANASFPYTTQYSTAGTRITVTFGEGVLDILNQPVGAYTMVTPAPVEPALTSFQPRHRVNSVQATGPAHFTGNLTQISDWHSAGPAARPAP